MVDRLRQRRSHPEEFLALLAQPHDGRTLCFPVVKEEAECYQMTTPGNGMTGPTHNPPFTMKYRAVGAPSATEVMNTESG